MTSSFGLAELTPDVQDPARLLERADVALYQAKRSGRNRVVLWAPGLEGEKKPEAAH